MDGFAFSEGELYLWTGQAPSEEIAYVQNTTVNFVRGVLNQQAVNGSYYDVVTGQRVNVNFTTTFTTDILLYRLLMQATGVHMKLNHSHDGGSAGWLLYSGIFDNMSVNGSQRGMFNAPVTYHANVWSAYGQ